MSPLAQEQYRNLRILGWSSVAVVVIGVGAAAALYLGYELPPREMMDYYASATGYAPPPKGVGAVPGTVPRGSLDLLSMARAPAGPGGPLAERGTVTGGPPGERAGRSGGRAPRPIGEQVLQEYVGPAAAERPGGAQTPEGSLPGGPRVNANSPPEGRGHPQPGGSGQSPGAHSTPVRELSAQRNPLPNSPSVLALGKRQYAINCGMCHGTPGGPPGPVAEHYQPRPPDLAEHLPHHSDAQLYSLITYGIRSTPTPEASRYLPEQWHAFRATTSPRERWAMVAYLRSLR